MPLFKRIEGPPNTDGDHVTPEPVDNRNDEIDIRDMPLEERIVPSEDESPTVAHIRALLHIVNNEHIPEKVVESIKQIATREEQNLQDSLETWNGIQQGENTMTVFFQQINYHNIADSMCHSFGSNNILNFHLRRQMLDSNLIKHGCKQWLTEK